MVISKTWKGRNKTKLAGCSEPEIRVLYFGCKIEETAKKAVSIIGMQHNKLYRSSAELPSNCSQHYESSVSCNQELSVLRGEENVIHAEEATTILSREGS